MQIVFISHQYPAVTQTFTYNEVMGLKKEGLNVQVYSFKKPIVLNLTPGMKEAIKETTYLPFILNPDIIFAQFYFLFLMPLRYLSLLSNVCFAKHQQYNNAELGTNEEVSKTSAKLIYESNQGYGYAIRSGLRATKGDLIVVCEPDNTFMAKDIIKLLAYSDDFAWC